MSHCPSSPWARWRCPLCCWWPWRRSGNEKNEAGPMTAGQRRLIFGLGAAGLVSFYLWGLLGLPGFGNYPGPCGFIINRLVVAQTNATAAVSAVNFVYRG